jgi:quinoprotein glucose dehydrogenase
MVLTVVVLDLAGCADKAERAVSLEGDPAAGADLWAEHCQECHASDGTGTETGPDLTDDSDTPDQLADKILNGWGEMDGFDDELSAQEVADLIAFLEQDVLLPL